jgi:hypothetical protein
VPRERWTSQRFAPLAVPLCVELVGRDDDTALAALGRRWHGTPDAHASPLALRIDVDDALAGIGPCHFRVDGRTLHLAREGTVEAYADPASGLAECRVSADLFARPEALLGDVIEPLVLYLLAHNDRPPVHASGFRAGALTVLLAGPSGSGKSSLALTADGAGFQVLSEDVIHVQRNPRLRVWGWPGPAHLLPGTGPDVQSHPPRLRNGTIKHAVPLRSAGAGCAVDGDLAVLCILRRGEHVALNRLAPDEARRMLERLEPGFDLMAEEVGEAHAALTRKGAWLLTLSRHPAEAIGLLSANFDRLRETAVP